MSLGLGGRRARRLGGCRIVGISMGTIREEPVDNIVDGNLDSAEMTLLRDVVAVIPRAAEVEIGVLGRVVTDMSDSCVVF